MRAEEHSTPSEPRRRSILQAAAVSAGIALTVTLAASGGNPSELAYGDGAIYLYVAAHFDADADEVNPVVSDRGTSLRYGRAGFPALIWVAAAGQKPAMPYAQAFIVVAAAGLIGAMTMMLLPRAGPAGGLLPWLAPGYPLAVSGGFAEALALPLAVAAVVAAQRRKWWLCWLALGLAILTRENAAAVAAALGVLAMIRKQPRGVVAAVASGIPALIWYAVVAARYGSFPPLDPYLRVATETVGPPVVALWHSLTMSSSPEALAMVLTHLVLGLVAVRFAPRNMFAFVGAICSFQVLIAGPFAWELIGEAARTGVFIQFFFVLLLAAERRRDRIPVGPDR